MSNIDPAGHLFYSQQPSPNVSSTTIDLGSLDTAAAELQFQDFSVNANPSRTLPPHHGMVTNANDDLLLSSPDAESSVPGEDSNIPNVNVPQPEVAFWEFSFFAKYFDVTTDDVTKRILYSLVPTPSSNGKGSYVERFIKNNPDLYGPLWINVTLIFSMAICGNIANYISSGDRETWHYDFTKLGLAASTISTYTIAVPIALWLFFWFRGCTFTYSLLELICTYGYSLSVYVPLSIIWALISLRSIQYVLVIVGAVMSGLVLLLSFTPVVNSDPSTTVKYSYLILLFILAIHAIVAFTFLVYFF